MIENELDYFNAISTTLNLNDTDTKLVYDVILNKNITKKSIRNSAILIRFNQLREENTSLSISECYFQLTADFNCSYKMVQRAVLDMT